jgi:hypothetical protein
MDEPTACINCASPIGPDDGVCPSCGTPVAGREVEFEDPRLIALRSMSPTADEPDDVEPPRLQAARDAASRAAAGAEAARQAAARASAEWQSAAVAASPTIDEEPPSLAPERAFEFEPAPAFAPAQTPALAPEPMLTPSSTNRTLGSIGGRPISAQLPVRAVPVAVPVPESLRSPASADAIGTAASASGGAIGAAPRPAPAAAAPEQVTALDWIKARLASISDEPKGELAAMGLVAMGAAFAVVGFFMPWASPNGWSLAVSGDPRPNAWAFDVSGGWTLFLISVALMALVLASDKLESFVPRFAPVIKRLTEVVAPLLLAGIYLGVFLLYRSAPWPTGSGPDLLAIAACLLVAGAIVGLFNPAVDPQP